MRYRISSMGLTASKTLRKKKIHKSETIQLENRKMKTNRVKEEEG